MIAVTVRPTGPVRAVNIPLIPPSPDTAVEIPLIAVEIPPIPRTSVPTTVIDGPIAATIPANAAGLIPRFCRNVEKDWILVITPSSAGDISPIASSTP